jgi:hypothetical protein
VSVSLSNFGMKRILQLIQSSLVILIFFSVFHNRLFAETEKPFLELDLSVSNDLIFRGESFNGDLTNARYNKSYRSYTDAWSLQPDIRFLTPLDGLTVFLWGNINLQHHGDRDTDKFLFQDAPGEMDRTQEIVSNLRRGELGFDPNQTKRYKERNGSERFSGAFMGADYAWNTRIGGFSFGSWLFSNSDSSDKFTWQEWFIQYRPDVLRFLNPEIGFYMNTSSSSQGIPGAPTNFINGQKYISLDLSHRFREEEFVQIEVGSHIGYLNGNNNVNRLSGISNITNMLRVYFGEFYVGTSWVYRPELKLFDIFDSNPKDGRTTDPSKLHGWQNQLIQDSIQQWTEPDEGLTNIVLEKMISQRIIRNLFTISFGYQTTF